MNNGDDRERPQMADDGGNDSQAWYRALVARISYLSHVVRLLQWVFTGTRRHFDRARRTSWFVGKSALLTHDVEKSGEQTHPAEYVARTPISFNAWRIDGSCTQDPSTWSDSSRQSGCTTGFIRRFLATQRSTDRYSVKHSQSRCATRPHVFPFVMQESTPLHCKWHQASQRTTCQTGRTLDTHNASLWGEALF